MDWARDDHAVAIVDASGQVVERLSVAHTAAGIRDLVPRLAEMGAHEVAIERPDGPVVDALLRRAPAPSAPGSAPPRMG